MSDSNQHKERERILNAIRYAPPQVAGDAAAAFISFEEQLEALREDARIAFGTWPVDPTCPLCGNGSAAHYCPPREEARARLRAWGEASSPASEPKEVA